MNNCLIKIEICMSKSNENILPKKPVEPDPSECCNRNCENCVYVYYEKALKRWQEKMDNMEKHKNN